MAQNYQYGGWYDNPATGKNQRWFNGTWTDGAEPGGGGSSGGGGGSAPAAPKYEFNPAAYDNLLTSMPKATEFAKGVNSIEDAALGDYFGYLNTQESPLAFYQRMENEAGLPNMRKAQATLQGQIFDLEDTLRRVEPNVTATTGQSIVTEAQRQGMVTAKQKPLLESLGWIGQSLGRVSNAITETTAQILNLTELQQQGVERFISAYKTRLDVAMKQGDRAMSAFIEDTNKILQVTLAKIARQEKVGDMEAANAFELLKLQKSAEIALEAERNKLITVGEGTSVYDPKTGQVVFTAPKQYKGDGDGADGDWDPYGDNTTQSGESEYEPYQFKDILEYNNWLRTQRGYK